ncbi:NAD(P)H nitroreductase [Secundilactobacillus paracollinoides]|uniref:NAD(P)H nitroreductase n=1 Tax=Secundilactobacillus paracollinoides TaxID=240427 RepID=A0A1B2IV35_9LACO|nr:nitroreductase family protein [Secundilactobacillus paracollinoides]ANZ62927.1 NAD(P)H nitroreductase [Secundilactobacillus paracollinoides]ANZ65913.1 NAD(P)H nitroreductase [Secundilactobacillus paracollinoides]KRL78381.1 transcription regulator [Secundilactobacillus paracollinoides DSM 15502 = JCM 11969]
MSSFKENDFQKIIEGRHAVHDFDPAVKINRTELTQMITESISAPSALNVQPWRIVIVDSPEAKAKIKPLMPANAHQNETASALVFFFADLKAAENAQDIYDQTVKAGKMPQEVSDHLVTIIKNVYDEMPTSALVATFTLDVALPAMQFMLIARAHGYETGPMTGFDHDKIAAALDLDPTRYVPVLLVAIGKAAQLSAGSVRLPAEKILSFR